MQLLQTSIVPRPDPVPYARYFQEILSNYLVEQAERHAVHHFVVHAWEGGRCVPRVFLWLFQPLVEMYAAEAMAVAKILYYPLDHVPEQPYLPVVLPERQCDTLYTQLVASTALYPKARQSLGAWQIGFLVRTHG